MKKVAAIWLLLCVIIFSNSALAVTLKTKSTFAGTDSATQTYVDLLKAWEEQTGNKVDDYSATSDEAWKSGVINDFAAGNEADVLFYFAKTSDSTPILNRVVPISVINEAYPHLNLPENALVAESDGVVYAIPVRNWWEGLFVNTDLFEQYGLELPTDWDKLVVAIEKFNEVGIVPIAASFSDIPHYLIECAILACGTPQDHSARPATIAQVPDSWIEGMRLLNTLYKMGAFPKNCNATTESITSKLFIDKKAAMQVDGSWFANGIPKESWDTTIVMPFPPYSENADQTALFMGVSSGFYLSKRAWDDPDKRDAAVSLLAYLTTPENAQQLGYDFTGALGESAQELVANCTPCAVIQDAMAPLVRSELWFAKIPNIVEGTLDPVAMWKNILNANPWQLALDE